MWIHGVYEQLSSDGQLLNTVVDIPHASEYGYRWTGGGTTTSNGCSGQVSRGVVTPLFEERCNFDLNQILGVAV